MVGKLSERRVSSHLPTAKDLEAVAASPGGVAIVTEAIDAHMSAGCSIIDAAQGRTLTASEQRATAAHAAEITQLRALAFEKSGPERRQGETEETFRRLQSRPVDQRTQTADEKDLDAAFRSAILAKNPAPIVVPVGPRTYYQPGVERRDLLKSTATQAMRVSVYDRIVEALVENTAVLRAGATLINTTTGEDLQVPKSTAFSTANLTAEGGLITESDPTLAVTTLKAYKYAAFFQVSHELANDTNTDLMGFVARQAGQALALAYGNSLINGTGVNEPRGVLADTTAGLVGPTGTATSLGAQGTADQGTDVLHGLHGSLAEPYAQAGSRAWLLRNASLSTIRKLKDTAGQPVIPVNANEFLGAPFVVDPFVPAMAANAKSIIYGDWSRYFVRIAEGLRFERSNDFAFQNDLVSFRAVIRIDGALVDTTGAIKHFAHSAT
ncbi:MAG: phage major capsid protein [Thermocrispum sp.]